MPSLRQLTCHIEGPGGISLPEYKVDYDDGNVDCHVVPLPPDVPFTIHLSSKGYIAYGLSMFVFIDGMPQCNRNRTGLVFPTPKTVRSDTEIDIRVRQKEERVNHERYIARDWMFAKLNVSETVKPSTIDPIIRANVGTIEVIVLRCYGDGRMQQSGQTASDAQLGVPQPSRWGLDGVHDDDFQEVDFMGLDGTGDRYRHRIIATDSECNLVMSRRRRRTPSPLSVIDEPRTDFDQHDRHDRNEPYRRSCAHGLDDHNDPEQRRRSQRNDYRDNTYRKSGPDDDDDYDDYPLRAPQRRSRPVNHDHHDQREESPRARRVQHERFARFEERSRSRPRDYRGHEPYAPRRSPRRYSTSPKGPQRADQSLTHTDIDNQIAQLESRKILVEAEEKERKLDAELAEKKKKVRRKAEEKIRKALEGQDRARPEAAGAGIIKSKKPESVVKESSDSGKSDKTDKETTDNQSSTADLEKKDEPGQGWDTNDAWGQTNGEPAKDWSIEDADSGWKTKEVKPVEDDASKSKKEEDAAKDKEEKEAKAKSKEEKKAPLDVPPASEPEPVDPNRLWIKSYWKSVVRPAAGAGNRNPQDNIFIYPEEPLIIFSADDKPFEVSHQVRYGKGALYYHQGSRPTYVDTFEDPYAVFVFNYRSKAMLKAIFKDDPDPIEFDTKKTLQQRIKGMSREELEERLVKLKMGERDEDGESGSDKESKVKPEVKAASVETPVVNAPSVNQDAKQGGVAKVGEGTWGGSTGWGSAPVAAAAAAAATSQTVW